MVKQLPLFTVLSAVRVPPMSSTMLRAMVRPSPMPGTPLRVVERWRSKGSKTRSKKPLSMPMPSSSTEKV